MTAPPGSRASVDAIRHAAALAVEERSLRSVAREVGMSPTGLRQFLNGRSPYTATLRRLNAWYARHQLSRAGFTPDVARSGMSILLEAFPDGMRGEVTAALLDWLHAEHVRRGVAPPHWLDALRDGSR